VGFSLTAPGGRYVPGQRLVESSGVLLGQIALVGHAPVGEGDRLCGVVAVDVIDECITMTRANATLLLRRCCTSPAMRDGINQVNG
jgi:hypothetical protein